MKKLFAAALVCVAAAAPVQADLYSDPANDVFTGAGGGILDILSVEVTNDATDVQFKLTLAGDPVATDWGKYMIIFDSVPGGDVAGNGWGRPISMPTGADYWVGSWVDSGNGVQLFNYSGAWNMTDANGPFAGPGGTPAASPNIGINKAVNEVTITASLAALGLNVGDKFWFDVFTSGGGGGDGAIDSLGNPNQQVSDWGQPSNANPVSYTVIPEPATLGLFALGVVTLLRRRR